MIKDVMVRLDATSGDDARLAAASQIAEIFESHITGLFFNVVPAGLDGVANQAAKSPDAARQAGDATESMLFQRLTGLQLPTNLRRFDVAADIDISEAALPGRGPPTPSSPFGRMVERMNRRSLLKTCCSAPEAVSFWFPMTGKASHRCTT